MYVGTVRDIQDSEKDDVFSMNWPCGVNQEYMTKYSLLNYLYSPLVIYILY